MIEAGNFARAGEALGLTPSGVSRAVARLEARVGVRLFDRTPRSATLTEEGRQFYNHVMPLLASIEDAAKLRVNVDPWFARVASTALPVRSRPAQPGCIRSCLNRCLPSRSSSVCSLGEQPWPCLHGFLRSSKWHFGCENCGRLWGGGEKAVREFDLQERVNGA